MTYDLLASKKNSALALKDHPHIPIIIDILSRRMNHHVLIHSVLSEKIHFALLESIAHYLNENNLPHILRNVNFLFCDTPDQLPALREELHTTSQLTLVALPSSMMDFIHEKTFNKCRVIIFSADQKTLPHFTTVKLTAPTTAQSIALLKTFKTELEHFHRVFIPDEMFVSAFSMAKHYLPADSHFDNALELIDSAAARASCAESFDHNNQNKPVVTTSILMQVLSSWTSIPMPHLNHAHFQSNKFLDTLQRRLFGQDAALHSIASALQQAHLPIREKRASFCSFLWVGPAEVGKRETAKVMAEYFFGHHSALLRVIANDDNQSISDIKVMTEDNRSMNLLSAVQQIPYAMLLVENIESTMLHLLKNIFIHGHAQDEEGNTYDFQRMMIIITTTLGAERIKNLTQPPHEQDTKTLDLLQLVLNDHPQEAGPSISHHLSLHELREELLPTLQEYFSASLLQHLHIVPFMPLDYAALEKIMRTKVKRLGKRLETQLGIELNYSPEIFKFLAHEAAWRKPQHKTIENILEQHLYTAVANEILNYTEDKNRPKRLLLRLNDNGQLLHCEFVSNDTVMHSM